MQRPIPWIWIALAACLLLAPGLVARLFLNVLEGVTLLVVLGPLLLAGVALVAWQLARRRLTTCPACGSVSLGQPLCPVCGCALEGVSPGGGSSPEPELTASDATIDVVAQVVEDDD